MLRTIHPRKFLLGIFGCLIVAIALLGGTHTTHAYIADALFDDFNDGDVTANPTWDVNNDNYYVINGVFNADGWNVDSSDRYINGLTLFPNPAIEAPDYLEFSYRGVLKSAGNPQAGRGIQYQLYNSQGYAYTLSIQNGYTGGFPVNQHSISLRYDYPNQPQDLIVSTFVPAYDHEYYIRAVRQQGIWTLYADGQVIGSTPDPLGVTQITFVRIGTFGSIALDDVSIKVSRPNNPPVLGPIYGPSDPVPVGTEVSMNADFSDPDMGDTHTAIWDWGDGSNSEGDVDDVAGNIVGSHAFTEPGIYTVELTVTDAHGESDTGTFQFVVVFDPEGGFVTGGGWMNSPSGACVEFCGDATGKAAFGFVSKYKKGGLIPTGNTEFNFSAGGLNFHSDTYDWLVVNQSSTNAQFKGSGTINGSGDYKFMLWAKDGDPDTFRIKIWSDDGGNETVVYDNGFDQAIGGGNIVVHSK